MALLKVEKSESKKVRGIFRLTTQRSGGLFQ